MKPGPFSLSTYTLCLGLALLLGVTRLYWGAATLARPPWRWVDGGLVAILGGLLAGRLGYVLVHWDYFTGHLGETWRIWQGGLDWYGALAGGFLALASWSRERGEPFADILDVLVQALAIGMVLTWLGCLRVGCGYGQEVLAPNPTFRWLTPELPDAYGVVAARYPTQLFGAVWAGLVGLLLYRLRRPTVPGVRFALFLLLYGAGAIMIDGTRGDTIPLVAGWRIDQVLDVGVVLASLGSLVWMRKVV